MKEEFSVTGGKMQTPRPVLGAISDGRPYRDEVTLSFNC